MEPQAKEQTLEEIVDAMRSIWTDKKARDADRVHAANVAARILMPCQPWNDKAAPDAVSEAA